jgi:hypothetical protein
MSTATLNVESVGHLSARAGVPLGRVLRAVEALGVRPALVVDDVLHLAETDAQRVAEHLVGQRGAGARDELSNPTG